MIAAAMSTLYSLPPTEVLTRLLRATVIGCVPEPEYTTPNKKSFHICVNCHIIVTTKIGVDKGRKICLKIAKNPAPSSFAALTSSVGMPT